ncbi:MAG TPA: glycosyltransferase [Stellaceae bacterium]|jgi:hopene-associated glycosyltransferase HpnB|nr:glycosyltransferase [Stellaceae bacterium]
MIALALLTLAIWLYLLFGRGFFWLARGTDEARSERRAVVRSENKESLPSVVAVIPARNEAAVVGRAIASLLAQDYAGDFRIVLVDDHSSDGTADAARMAAGAQSDRIAIVAARPLPAGWTGKLWALSEGVRQIAVPPALYLFTDADIAHHPSNLSELVARLEGERRDLVSLMVKLRCESLAERFLIPPFVFFFAMLYPFAWSNDSRRATAAAAGGCILLRRSAYERIGGWESLKGELIDDCALARKVKRGGAIWLGLTQRTISLRAYPRIADIWNMVARTAYTQLGYSPLLLGGTVLGMTATYFLPLVLLLSGGGAAVIGALSWAAMVVAYAPMLRFYGLSLAWAPLLPAAASVYLAATVASAWRHWRGRGGEWKGRVQWQNRC